MRLHYLPIVIYLLKLQGGEGGGGSEKSWIATYLLAYLW